jgi:imidazolonepropionase-like amidohydrolase
VTSFRVAATVLPDGGGRAELWTRDGRLTTTPQPDAEDLPGRYVLPGLVDAHAHLTIDMSGTGLPTASDDLVRANLQAHRANGVLLVRDIGRVRDEPLRPAEDDPDLRQAGRFLGPENGWVPALHQPTPPERLLDTVTAQLATGIEWVKVIGDWKHGTEIRQNYDSALLREVAALAHAGGARFALHATAADACRAAVEAGADSVEHGCALDDDAIATMADRRVAWTPTLSAVTFPPPPDATPEQRQRRQDWLDNLRERLPRAVALGVPVLAGTDTAAHGSVAAEVALLVEFGVDPVAAIRAATTTAREFLDAPSLADGTPADLVTFEQDPREDPAVLRSPAAVLHRGVRVR